MINSEIEVNNLKLIIEPNEIYGIAGKVYNGAFSLVDYIDRNLSKLDLSKTNVLELGSGTGIGGFAFGCYGGDNVVVSDLQRSSPLNEEKCRAK